MFTILPARKVWRFVCSWWKKEQYWCLAQAVTVFDAVYVKWGNKFCILWRTSNSKCCLYKMWRWSRPCHISPSSALKVKNKKVPAHTKVLNISYVYSACRDKYFHYSPSHCISFIRKTILTGPFKSTFITFCVKLMQWINFRLALPLWSLISVQLNCLKYCHHVVWLHHHTVDVSGEWRWKGLHSEGTCVRTSQHTS